MRILHISSECAPWAKSGGLGDVVGALPDALLQARPDAQVAVVLPLYAKAKAELNKRGMSLEDTGVVADVAMHSVTARVRFLRLAREGRATVFFAACDAAFGRDGLYGYSDDGERFILLCKATVAMAGKLMGGPPDILHTHDWHAALAAALANTSARGLMPRTKSLVTIHNLAYQGIVSKDLLPVSGLGWEHFHLDCAEWHDNLSLLKAGMSLADAVTTVSPTYAREIRTPEFGAQLDAFLRRRRIFGILNGIDTDEWNPESDPHVAGSWTADDLSGKQEARKALLELCKWDDHPGVPTFGVVSRMTSQKGLDLLLPLVGELHGMGARLVVLGTGEPGLEEGFQLAARHYQSNVRTDINFDVPLSHKIIAGCDGLLVPSRFEPCGLTQMYAMRVGTVPIVRATGGLADTVTPDRGFAFEHSTVQGLRWAMRTAAHTYREQPGRWKAMQQNGMRHDWSWKASAARYLALYDALLA